jgi:hypothetical protein
MLFNRRGILAFTDSRIAVFSSGWLALRRSKPKKLLYSLPRTTPLPHGRGKWSKVTVGDERIWFARSVYRYLDEATGATA